MHERCCSNESGGQAKGNRVTLKLVAEGLPARNLRTNSRNEANLSKTTIDSLGSEAVEVHRERLLYLNGGGHLASWLHRGHSLRFVRRANKNSRASWSVF